MRRLPIRPIFLSLLCLLFLSSPGFASSTYCPEYDSSCDVKNPFDEDYIPLDPYEDEDGDDFDNSYEDEYGTDPYDPSDYPELDPYENPLDYPEYEDLDMMVYQTQIGMEMAIQMMKKKRGVQILTIRRVTQKMKSLIRKFMKMLGTLIVILMDGLTLMNFYMGPIQIIFMISLEVTTILGCQT